ncbi:hypothetical protein TanjilG_32783 [Lupinus angustifolius]|uniref:Uncharacterized protein n=1 Tax=Lupinus angustifolius TaxID=3871 RepID=A0A4P1RFQ8_LUPAN|nr:hypothetical protein TanjilG_32783 [Lupinus angustifolius]
MENYAQSVAYKKNLQRRDIDHRSDNLCVFCKDAVETVNHFFPHDSVWQECYNTHGWRISFYAAFMVGNL